MEIKPLEAIRYPVGLLKGTMWSYSLHYRQGKRYSLTLRWDGITVSEEGRRGEEPKWSVTFPQTLFTYEELSGEKNMASRYISKAVSQVKPGAQSLPTTDPTLFRDRPALAEYMGLMVDDEGVGREPSPLMVVVRPDGIRVGIKDCETGGWVWREAETFCKGLNSLEAILASGAVVWSVPGGKAGKNGKK